MDFNRALIDLSQEDEWVVKNFAALHPDLAAFIKDRKDNLDTLSDAAIVKYIVACYDKESPLMEAFKKRWWVKKKEAAEIAGFKKDNAGYYSEDADRVMFCQNDVINRVVLRYLYLIHDRLFQTYVIYNEMYLHQSAELMRYDFAQPSHAKAAKENLDILGRDIEELESKIFSGEETKKMRDLLYEEASNLLSDLRPERIALRLEKDQPAVDYNPHGNYKPETMHFMGDE